MVLIALTNSVESKPASRNPPKNANIVTAMVIRKVRDAVRYPRPGNLDCSAFIRDFPVALGKAVPNSPG